MNEADDTPDAPQDGGPAAAPVEETLQQARALYERGQVLEAGEVCERFLAVHEEHAEIRHMLGAAFRAAGRPDAACQHFRRAAERAPDHGPYWRDLASALGECGYHLAAVEPARRCFTLDAESPAAMEAYGLALARAFKEDQARHLVENAVEAFGHDPNWLRAGAAVFRAIEAYDDAAALYQRVLELAPDHVPTRHALGIALRMAGRPDEAIPHLEQVSEARMLAAEPRVVLAHAHNQRGDAETAIRFYEEAFERDPAQFDAHEGVIRLLYRMGDDEALRNHLRLLSVRAQKEPRLRLLKASTELRIGEPAAALETLSAAKRDFGMIPAFEDAAGQACFDVGDLDQAVAHHEEALRWRPFDVGFLCNAARTALRRRDFLKAGQYARAVLNGDPLNQFGLAYFWTALVGLEREDDARRLINVDRFAQPLDLGPPAGWTRMEDFLRDLRTELDALHDSEREPIDQTLRGGTQTSEALFSHKTPAIQGVRAILARAIDRYAEMLPPDAGHAFLGRKSKRWRFTGSWSVRLVDEGFHVNHIHPEGWVSSAFYVNVPDDMGEEAHAGWLGFGQPPAELELDWEPVKRVEPKPGRLALFPSCLWHGTIPFRAEAPRMTVAFDVRPT